MDRYERGMTCCKESLSKRLSMVYLVSACRPSCFWERWGKDEMDGPAFAIGAWDSHKGKSGCGIALESASTYALKSSQTACDAIRQLSC